MKSFRMLAVLAAPISALAGPPFQTDDPEPIDFRHYEFYTFASSDGTNVETDTFGPALEFNWGAVPNVHLHVIVPMAAILPANNPALAPSGIGPRAFGLGDMELGIKYRFVQETKHRPMIGTFTMFEIPTGSAARGLGVGQNLVQNSTLGAEELRSVDDLRWRRRNSDKRRRLSQFSVCGMAAAARLGKEINAGN